MNQLLSDRLRESIMRTCVLFVLLLTTALTAAEPDATQNQIEPLLRALQERYHTVTGTYLLLPANANQQRPFTFENATSNKITAGGNPFPSDGFYNGISEVQQTAMANDIINNCGFVVSQYQEGPTPDAAFLSMPEVKNLPTSLALQTAIETLRKCRYVHFGPGGHQVLPVKKTIRRIDISRRTQIPPLDVEWFNAGFAGMIFPIYDKTHEGTDDNVYAFSQRTKGEQGIGLNGAGGLIYKTVGTGFEYGFRIAYDLSEWSGASIRPYYAITWYSGLGNSDLTTPIWPSAPGLPAITPPLWIPPSTTTSVESPLVPWMTNVGKQQGDIRKSVDFPGSAPLVCSKQTIISLGMDFDATSIGENWILNSIYDYGYFYQIDYRGFMADLDGKFTNPIPVQQPIIPADVYPGSCPGCVGVIAKDFSLIDNGSMTYYHDAWDYRVGTASGCATCGGAAGAGASMVDLSLGRIHRYHDLDWGASFGPGVLCNHDVRLQVFANEQGGLAARFFDPLQRVVCELTAATGDTVLHDAAAVALELTLRDAADTATTDLSVARTAVLRLKDERTLEFQLFPQQSGDSSALAGRVVRVADQQSHHMVYAYADADPQAVMSTADADASMLWRFVGIVDQRGVSASFTWKQAVGQWVIDTATMPGGGVFHYAYADSGLVSLQGVSYPTGETSTFTPSWDDANQWVTLAIDDAGSETTHRRKQVSLTPSIETGFAGVVQTQMPNLIRQVRNGTGELSYRNWVVANGAILDLYNYTGGGVDGAGVLRWMHYQDGRPVSSKIAARYFPGQSFDSHTWLDESTYETDNHMRPMAMAEPDGSSTAYERDAAGNITTTTHKRPDGSVISTESTTWDDQRHPLVVTDALHRVTRNDYDAAGRLQRRTVALGTSDEAHWDYAYDAAGRLSQAVDANLNATDYSYDPVTGQVATITEPPDVVGGQRFTRTFTYDAAGRPLTSADQAGRTATYYYDGRGRPTVTAYADGSSEETVYGTGVDANLVATRKDRNGVWEVFGYDGAGRQLSAVLNPGQPDQVVRSRAYVPGKNLLASETVNGTTTAYTYDSRGRVASVIQAANATVAHVSSSETWDADNVSISTDNFGRSSWSLQTPDRLRSRTVRELTPGVVSSTLIGDTAQRTAALWALPPPAVNQNATYTIDESLADVVGQLAVRTDALGAVTTQDYDQQGRTTATVVTDRFGIITRSESGYDANGNRIRMVQPRSFAANGSPLTLIVSNTTYTGRNLVASQRESFTDEQGTPVVAETFFSYSPTGKVATSSDPRNPTWLTSSTYGECCDRLKTLVDAKGFQTAFTYDSLGRQRTTTDANLHVLETRYDAQGRVTARIDGRSKQTDMAYDQDLTDGFGLDQQFPTLIAGLGFGPGAVGAADLTTLPTGERSLVIRDGLGRTVRQAQLGKLGTTTAPQMVTTTYDLPPVAPKNGVATDGLEGVAVTDAVGKTTTTWRDAAGRVVRVDLPSGGMLATIYDPAGNPLREIDANGVVTTLTYDGQGRVATQQVGSTGGMSRQYDVAGNVVAETDAKGVTTTRVYDGFNRLIRVAHPVLGTTRMTYDLAGNLATITDHEGGVTSYEYDERGRLLSETHPGSSGGTQATTYYPAGQVKTRTDRRGIVTTFIYDAADRVTAKNYSTGNHEDFAYDDQGRLLTATSSRYGTTVQRTYDPGTGELARETQQTPAGTAQVTMAYDAQHRPQSYTLDDGTSLGQDYTPLGQVGAAKLDGQVVATRDLDAGGRLQFVTYASRVRESRQYTDGNLVERLTVKPGQTQQQAQLPAFMDLSYGYDERRRKTSEADLSPLGERQSFIFDDAGRLTTWTRTPGSGGPLNTSAQSPAPAKDQQTWQLSPVGDWQATTRNGHAETRTHSPVHATTSVTENAITTALTYDANGNLTQDERGNRYVWDEENRLVSVSVRDAAEGVTSTAHMTYDALGRRLTRSAFGTTTQFVLNGSQVLQERDQRRLPGGNRERASDGDLTPADAPAPAGSILTVAGTRYLRHQPADITIPDGWIADKGRALAERTNGLTYGWQDVSSAPIELTASQAVVRDVMPLPQFDAFHRFTEAGAASTWRYALPNGTYAVVVVAGDAASRQHTNHLVLNGLTLTDPDPYSAAESPGYLKGDFDGWAETVTVSDGYLTLGGGAGALDPTVCFLEIGPLGSSVDQALRDKLAQAITDATNRTGGDPFRKVPTPRTFVYGGDYIDAPVAFRAGSGASARLYGIHANHLFSVAAITDADGMVVERYTYGPYGDRRLEGESTGFSRFGLTVGFTGLRDEDGLLFARARYFSPTLGRWISRDPAGYVDGYSLYNGYFVPNANDPEGKFIGTLVAGAVIGGLLDAADQWANIAMGSQSEWDWGRTIFSAGTGAIGGGFWKFGGMWTKTILTSISGGLTFQAGQNAYSAYLTYGGYDPRTLVSVGLTSVGLFGTGWMTRQMSLNYKGLTLKNDTSCTPQQQPAPTVIAEKYPAAGFVVESGQAGTFHRITISYSSNANRGFIQGIFDRSTNDLYIDLIKSDIQGEGLGSALFTKIIAEIKLAGGNVKTISGNFARDSSNLQVLVDEGSLQATPGFKLRFRAGYTKVVIAPNGQNGYLLTMEKP